MKSNRFFPEIKGNFGFGCMRLPMLDGEVDIEQFKAMADAFMAAGFNYFDTAHGYIQGRSETAIREAVVKRFPRDSFVLTDKLSTHFFNSPEELPALFESQLEACGVDFFDFYLMHAQDGAIYEKFKRCGAYEFAVELLKAGKIRHFGISFHDKAAVLDRILTEQPAIEVVQIQFNYIDYESEAVESRKVYEVCEKHGKPVIVMEPVKGGSLVNLPEEADRVFRALGGGSNATYAVRFAASFPQIAVVLSGMSTEEQMADNLSAMVDFKPLDEEEMAAVKKVCSIFTAQQRIPCTACRYCTDGCPMQILIPDLFSLMNARKALPNMNQNYYYSKIVTRDNGKASDCIACGQCEGICPQHLPIIELMREVAKEFEEQ